MLARPLNVAVDARGRVFVADESDKDIKVYDPSGDRVATFGRAGRGPGEFASLMTVQTYRDSVMAYDFVLKRLSVFAPTGEFTRAATLSSDPYTVRVLDDSLLLAIRHPGQRGPLLHLHYPSGDAVAAFYDRDGFFDADRQLRYLTAVFADGRDGIIFAAVFGDDSVFAFDYGGRPVAAGRIETSLPLGSLPVALRESGGRTQRPDGTWFHHGLRAVMMLVALDQGRAAVFVAPYDTKVGTDLLEGGVIAVVQVEGDAIITRAEAPIRSGLMGRDRDGAPMTLGYGDDEFKTIVARRVLLN